MTGERVRGAVLYATAALLLAGGATWWFRSAPPDRDNGRTEQWRTAAESALPDTETQIDAGTVELPGGADRTFDTSVETGEYLVSVVCRGSEESYIRISLSQSGNDSGRGLLCTSNRRPETLRVGLADSMHLQVVVGDYPVVFRYSLQRI